VGFGDPFFYGVDTAVHLGNHSARDGSIIDQVGDTLDVDGRNQLTLFVFDPFNIGQQNQFFRFEGSGDSTGNQIGVNIVGLTVQTATDGSDDGDKITLFQISDDRRIATMPISMISGVNVSGLTVVISSLRA